MTTITKTLEKDTRRQWGNSWHLADVSCASSCDLRRWLGGSKAIRTLGFYFLVSVRARECGVVGRWINLPSSHPYSVSGALLGSDGNGQRKVGKEGQREIVG